MQPFRATFAAGIQEGGARCMDSLPGKSPISRFIINRLIKPRQIVLWSIVSLSQFWLTGKGTFLACRYGKTTLTAFIKLPTSGARCLLGFIQGGFIPDIVLYLSYFYTKTEREW